MRRRILFSLELIAVGALVLITRCANYGDVFAGGKIYFVDADCYARMTRARICFERPGTIIRHHDFENFPVGTSPHTTAPLDYLIVAIAAVLSAFAAANASTVLDLSGAIVSPFIAVALGIFLCWWTRRMAMRFRFALLALYAVSPILAHGTALGRPDHQSPLIALVAVALCADWMLMSLEERAPREARPSDARQSSARYSLQRWNVLSGAAWATAIWVSLYEPLILLGLAITARGLIRSSKRVVAAVRPRRQKRTTTSSALPLRTDGSYNARPLFAKCIAFAAVIAVAMLIERRTPAWINHESLAAFTSWSGTIGELSRVPLTSTAWFQWCSWLLLLSPILFWRRGDVPAVILMLLVATFALTAMQARWAYFFTIIFALVAPGILKIIGRPVLVYVLFFIALFPVAQAWDESLSDQRAAARAEAQIEQSELRAIASEIDGPLLGPWWLSPALSYWSGEPAVTGSSHESLTGITDSARFYATTETAPAAEICRLHQVKWVLSYDADRVAQNSSRVLRQAISPDALCYRLDRHPSAAPPFLKLVRQTARFKLYRVEDL